MCPDSRRFHRRHASNLSLHPLRFQTSDHDQDKMQLSTKLFGHYELTGGGVDPARFSEDDGSLGLFCCAVEINNTIFVFFGKSPFFSSAQVRFQP